MVKNTLSLKDNLKYIKTQYGEMIENAVFLWGGRPEVIAGIIMRETEGGLSSLLDKQGPEGRGDKDYNGVYHGHGLGQIDDRWFSTFIKSGKWKDPAENIKYIAYILSMKTSFFVRKKLPPADVERAGIAAYNGGEGAVWGAIKREEDFDSVTAHHNYSAQVLEFAQIYKALDE